MPDASTFPSRRSFRSPSEQELEDLCSKARQLLGSMARYAELVGGKPHCEIERLAYGNTVGSLRDSAFELERIFNPMKQPWDRRLFVFPCLNRPGVDGWPLPELQEALQWIHSLIGELLNVMDWKEMSEGRLVIHSPDERGPCDVDHGGDIYRCFNPATFVWPALESSLIERFAVVLRELVGIVQAAKWQASDLELEWRTFREARQHGITSVTFTAARSEPSAADGSPSETERNGLATIRLTERHSTALAALLELKAVDFDSRRTGQDVAEKAAGKNADAEQFKAPLAELVRLGFVASQRGRGGGCWLTATGKTQAEKR